MGGTVVHQVFGERACGVQFMTITRSRFRGRLWLWWGRRAVGANMMGTDL